jgi:ADP-ribosylglycohydrolase
MKAVNLGEDADTTGAVYGQLAGLCIIHCHMGCINFLFNRIL